MPPWNWRSKPVHCDNLLPLKAQRAHGTSSCPYAPRLRQNHDWNVFMPRPHRSQQPHTTHRRAVPTWPSPFRRTLHFTTECRQRRPDLQDAGGELPEQQARGVQDRCRCAQYARCAARCACRGRPCLRSGCSSPRGASKDEPTQSLAALAGSSVERHGGSSAERSPFVSAPCRHPPGRHSHVRSVWRAWPGSRSRLSPTRSRRWLHTRAAMVAMSRMRSSSCARARPRFWHNREARW